MQGGSSVDAYRVDGIPSRNGLTGKLGGRDGTLNAMGYELPRSLDDHDVPENAARCFDENTATNT